MNEMVKQMMEFLEVEDVSYTIDYVCPQHTGSISTEYGNLYFETTPPDVENHSHPGMLFKAGELIILETYDIEQVINLLKLNI